MGRAPHSNASKMVKGVGTEVSFKPTGSQLPLAQHSLLILKPHTRVALCG